VYRGSTFWHAAVAVSLIDWYSGSSVKSEELACQNRQPQQVPQDQSSCLISCRCARTCRNPLELGDAADHPLGLHVQRLGCGQLHSKAILSISETSADAPLPRPNSRHCRLRRVSALRGPSSGLLDQLWLDHLRLQRPSWPSGIRTRRRIFGGTSSNPGFSGHRGESFIIGHQGMQ